MTQEHSVLFFGMHESAFIYFFIEDFNRMFLTFSFFAVRKHLRLRKMKNIGKYKVVCCLKNPFSIVLQTLECLIALLYIPWFSNYIARRFQIAMVSCTYNLSLFYLQYMINFSIMKHIVLSILKECIYITSKVYYSSRFKLISQMIIFFKNKYYYI